MKIFVRDGLLKQFDVSSEPLERTKGSSQKFTHRGQTKELSYGREGVWTRFVVRSTVKKKKKRKKARPIALRCLHSEPISPSVASHCAISNKSEQKRLEVHACGCNQSIADIDWLLKALNRQ